MAQPEKPSIWVASVARLESTPLLAISLALFMVLVAFLVRMVIHSHLPPGYPFITFFPAVVVASYLCGWRIGTLAAVLSGLLAWYFFIPPFHSFLGNDGTLIAMSFYAFVTLTDIVLIWALESAARQARIAEQRAKQVADDRAVLFHELQHRVSNNLQFVSAILGIEARRVEDPIARKALNDAGARMALVGRIQRSLHDPDRQTTSFQAVAHDLVTDALAVAGAEHITFSLHGDSALDPDRAPPVALILLECVNNAVEHAFAGRVAGHLTISLRPLDDRRTVMTICDDGVGPKDAMGMSKSLGLKLVRQLAQQLDGQFDLRSGDDGGAVATLIFSSVA